MIFGIIVVKTLLTSDEVKIINLVVQWSYEGAYNLRVAGSRPVSAINPSSAHAVESAE